jgi:hypothetical protein
VGQGESRLAYTASAGTLPLTGAKGEVTAHVFYVAYSLEPSGSASAPARAITFVFNGGPGAASAFLHLAAMGPRGVNFSANGAAALEPVQLADNPDTWLGFTDLVFVDPVATGYSRSAGGTEEANRAFFGVDKDADAMADFARLYLTRAGRMLSPVFLVGESYGGFRAVHVAERLLAGGIAVRGAVLISPALEFSLLRGNCLRAAAADVGAALAGGRASGAARRPAGLARHPAGGRTLRRRPLSRATCGGPQKRRGDRSHACPLHGAAGGADPARARPGVGAHLCARIPEGQGPGAQPL